LSEAFFQLVGIGFTLDRRYMRSQRGFFELLRVSQTAFACSATPSDG
jgi:hypothetical protein